MQRRLYLALGPLALLPLVPGAWAQPDLSIEEAPEFVYHDYFPRCHADGPSGIVVNDYTFFERILGWDVPPPSVHVFSFHSYVRGLSGLNGTREWSHDNLFWHKLPGPQVTNQDWYWAPIRGGNWWPDLNPAPYYLDGDAPIDNLQPSEDVDGDGVCDFLAYGWEYNRPARLPRFTPIETGIGAPASSAGEGSLAMLSGATGDILWSLPIEWTRTDAGSGTFVLLDFPTGLLSFSSPSGPKFAWKTTDVVYEYEAGVWTITEKVLLGNAKDGSEIWKRDDLVKVGDWAVSTYLTGVVDLAGSGEPEVVLDDLEYVPEAVDECERPVRITVQALRAEDGQDLWGPTNYFTPSQNGQLPNTEESEECFRGSWAHVVTDVNAKGRGDVVGTYLTELARAANNEEASTTVNGRHTTHVAPVDGEDGTVMWQGKDLKQQGWGFVADLNPSPDRAVPYLAVGLIDLPSQPAAGARFPIKDVRLTVFDVLNGGPLWGTYRDGLALDSNLIYDVTLQQYRSALAPHDWDGDGAKDIVTPARYMEPNTTTQRLMSGSGHEYQILSGRDGHVIERLEAFGPRGQVLACPGQPPDELTVLSGHARRLDASRGAPGDDEPAWRHPVYVNRRPDSQIATTEAIFMGPRCGVPEDGRSMVGLSKGLFSLRRGFEIKGIHGFVAANGTVDWLVPKMSLIPPNVATLDEFHSPPDVDLQPVQKVSLSAGSVASGLATGLGLMALRNRLRRNGGDAA